MLRQRKAKHTEGVVVYLADAAIYNACPLKAACTESSQGRQVQRSTYVEYLDRVRAYHEAAALEAGLGTSTVAKWGDGGPSSASTIAGLAQIAPITRLSFAPT